MEGISRVTARISEIRAMAMTHTAPMGSFAAELERARAAKPAVGDGEESVEIEGSNGVAFDLAPGAVYTQSATIGSMLGLQPNAPVLEPITGIPTQDQLRMYLFEHQIEQRNGKLSVHDLVPISGTHHGNGKLLPPAAAAWEKMREAATADGIDLVAIDSYRTYESQDRAHQQHLAGIKKANVLPPGTSEHGNGLAVDITNGSIIDRTDREWHWLNTNATRFGWHPISNEAWHWEFRGVRPA